MSPSNDREFARVYANSEVTTSGSNRHPIYPSPATRYFAATSGSTFVPMTAVIRGVASSFG